MLHGREPSSRNTARSRVVVAAALSIAAMMTAGCGSDSDAASAPPPINLSQLDTGSYKTEPQDLVPTDPTLMARKMEALRLGNWMPLMQEIDPALRYGNSGIHPFTDVDTFFRGTLVGSPTKEPITDPSGFISGFAASGRSNLDDVIAYELTTAVMVFESEAAASTAASLLAQLELTPGQLHPRVATQSLEHPAAHVNWNPELQSLTSWFASGRFVVSAQVLNGENATLKVSDLPGLLALSDKSITVLTNRLNEFQPTSPDKIADLPSDPQQMMRITLLRPAGDLTAFAMEGTLDQHGALQKAREPDKQRRHYEKAGVDYVSFGAGKLVRTRDADAATTVVADTYPNRYQRRIEAPPGLPGAVCTEYIGADTREFKFTCYVTFGRYAAEVWSPLKQDAYQRISAQYAMLANDK